MKSHTTLSILIPSLVLSFGCGAPPASQASSPEASASQAPSPEAEASSREASSREASSREASSPEQQMEKRSIGKLMETKSALSIGERITFYKTLKRESPDVYNFEVEKELNQYGYSLLFSGKTEEAIEIFKLLVSEFPNDANPYDSLAEAYKKQGNQELAIINYEKAFAINPSNSHAEFEVKVMRGVLDILDTDWGKEIFEVPVRFAPKMTLVGFEDARFTKGWGKQDSDDFWSYVFAWKVDQKGKVPVDVLETNLALYFDGLMNRDKKTDAPPTAKLTQVKGPKRSVILEGTIDFMDTRLTKGRLVLNIRAESRFCAEQGKAVVVFWFSPKPFKHAIWTTLHTVKVLPEICSK